MEITNKNEQYIHKKTVCTFSIIHKYRGDLFQKFYVK